MNYSELLQLGVSINGGDPTMVGRWFRGTLFQETSNSRSWLTLVHAPLRLKKNMPFETWCIARIYSSYQSEWGVHRLPTTSLVSGGKHENNKISHYTTITISYYTPSAKGKSIINGSFGWQSVNNFQREVRLSRSGHTCAMVKRQSWIFFQWLFIKWEMYGNVVHD